jgi:hypothetical protein
MPVAYGLDSSPLINRGGKMKNVTAVIFTICFISVILNIGLVTRYVSIGHTDVCVPSMALGELQ